MDLNNENVKGMEYDPELAKQIQSDASANLHRFLSDFDFDAELEKNTQPIAENNFSEFEDDNGTYVPTGIELNGYYLYGSKTDEDSYAIRKMNKKTRFVKIYQSLTPHKIDKFIVMPGWDEILYYNTITNRMTKKSIR